MALDLRRGGRQQVFDLDGGRETRRPQPFRVKAEPHVGYCLDDDPGGKRWLGRGQASQLDL